MLTKKMLNDFMEETYNKPARQTQYILPARIYDLALETLFKTENDKAMFKSMHIRS